MLPAEFSSRSAPLGFEGFVRFLCFFALGLRCCVGFLRSQLFTAASQGGASLVAREP